MRNLIPLALAGAALLALGACVKPPENREVEALESHYFEELYRAHPTQASCDGLHQYDGGLDDMTSLAFGRRIDTLMRQLVRVGNLRAGGLDQAGDVRIGVIEAAIRRELLRLKNEEVWRKRPSFYLAPLFLSARRLMLRRDTAASARAKSMVVSINEAEALLAGLRGNVESVTPADYQSASASLERLKLLLRADLPPWGRRAAGVDLTLARSLDPDSGLQIAMDSVKETGRWMKEELQPSMTGSPALGPENFVMELLFDSHLELRVSELVRLAGQRLDQDSEAFAAAARAISPGTPPAALWRKTAKPPIPRGDMMAVAGHELEALSRFLREKDLIALPPEVGAEKNGRQYRVQETPRFLRNATGLYQVDLPSQQTNLFGGAGAGGGKALRKDGVFLLSYPDESWSPELREDSRAQLTREGLQLAAIHQMIPGLYLQSVLMRDNPLRVARMLPSRITTAGWGHYVEAMVVEQGFSAGSPRLRLTMLQRALVRDCRFLAAVRFHTRNMSLKQVAALFARRAYLGPALAELEARRLALDPLRAADALGKALILQLRDEYRAATGSRYSLRRFHDEFLRHGALPIPLIRKQMLAPQK